MKYSFLLFGALFGFIMSRAGATTFDFYAKLFLFENLQLMFVIGSAVVVGVIGMQILKRFRVVALSTGEALSFKSKPMRKGIVIGALMFGLGWGVTGACPGSAPVMIGEGKLLPIFTMIGIGLGTYLFGLVASMKMAKSDKLVLANQAR